jgi:hypothetical protein
MHQTIFLWSLFLWVLSSTNYDQNFKIILSKNDLNLRYPLDIYGPTHLENLGGGNLTKSENLDSGEELNKE